MIKPLLTLVASALIANQAIAYDNGPQVIGCDYRLTVKSAMKTDTCFLPTTGMQMGISTMIIRPGNSNTY